MTWHPSIVGFPAPKHLVCAFSLFPQVVFLVEHLLRHNTMQHFQAYLLRSIKMIT